MLNSAKEYDGIKIAGGKFNANTAALKTMSDRVLEIAPDCIAVMFGLDNEKANIAVGTRSAIFAPQRPGI